MSELVCEVCGNDLSGDLRKGWLAWYVARATYKAPVEDIFVTCHAKCAKVIRAQQELLGRMPLDHHLEVFAGRMAMRKFTDILYAYEWKANALRKAALVFRILAECRTDRTRETHYFEFEM